MIYVRNTHCIWNVKSVIVSLNLLFGKVIATQLEIYLQGRERVCHEDSVK